MSLLVSLSGTSYACIKKTVLDACQKSLEIFMFHHFALPEDVGVVCILPENHPCDCEASPSFLKEA